ncbi:MAG: Ser/Thr protein kinase RdoA (MazF antagonist) [Paracoccaceae bacterium]|jgi:Ser/Thr protein kinase RdoA (MazF antagonist)
MMIASATNAIAAWGGATTVPSLISHRENAVFAVTLKSNQKVALRLHRPGYNSKAEIQSELWWTKQLVDAGFPAPEPIATTTGELLFELADGQFATVISWAEGRQIGASGTALEGTLDTQIALYESLGQLLAQLHAQSDAMTLPAEFTRRNWNIDGFLGPDPLWGRFWENPALDAKTRDIVLAARNKARDDLVDYMDGGADQGLIHADALRENVFRQGGDLSLIDFDDSGFGFRLYDLTVALSQSIGDQNFAALQGAILAGYGQIKPVQQADVDRFHLFVMLRSFASFGWVMPRLSADDPANAKYLYRINWAARKYLDQA